MLQLRRSALRTAQRLRPRPQIRHDSSDAPSGHAASAGKAEPTHHPPHPEPVNESLGVRRSPPPAPLPPHHPFDTNAPHPQKGFYITIALLPLSFALYKFSHSTHNASDPSTQPLLTRLIHSYSNYKQRWIDRNAAHTKMMEQAAHDRNLFQSTPGSRMIDLKFPECVGLVFLCESCLSGMVGLTELGR